MINRHLGARKYSMSSKLKKLLTNNYQLPTSIVSFVFLLLLSTASPVFADLPNPLNPSDPSKMVPIATIIGRVVKGAFGLAGSVALLIFIWGGFLWISARGDEKQVKQGWDTVTWGALGIMVIFGSYIIAEQLLKIFGIQ